MKSFLIAIKSWYEKGNQITYIPRNSFGMFSEIFTPLILVTRDFNLSIAIATIIGLGYFVITIIVGRFWSEKGLMKEQTNFELQEHRNDTADIIANKVIEKMNGKENSNKGN